MFRATSCARVLLFGGIIAMVPLVASGQRETSSDDPASFAQLAATFTARWAVFELPFLEVRASDPNAVHPAALTRLATFVQETVASFQFDESSLRELERNPIRYFFCADLHEVHFLSGTATEGVALLAHRAIVTQWLPHEHEIVHILAQMAAGGRMVDFDPTLEEGLATYLGGRGGLSAETVLTLGERALDDSDMHISRLWSPDRFHALAPDVESAYAVSARWVQYLVERGGMVRFLRLYRLLASWSNDFVDRPSGYTQTQLEGMYEVSFETLLDDFQRWRRATHPSVLVSAHPLLREADLLQGHDAREARVWWEDDGAVISLWGGDRFPDALLQWGEPLPRGFRSRLLSRHRNAQELRYGLRMDPNGVELYDFALDKTIALLTPPPPPVTGLRDSFPRHVTVRLLEAGWRHVTRPTSLTVMAAPTLSP